MKNIIDKKSLLKALTNIPNAQDRFIVMALFYGIIGTDCRDLLDLKVSDIDLENNIIKIEDKIIPIEKEFKEIIVAAINQKIYLANSNNSFGNMDFVMNEQSEYIIKVRPTVVNRFGLDALSLNALKDRIRTLSKLMGIKINTRNLVTSGAIYRVLKENKRNDEGRIIVKDVENTLLKYGYVLSTYRIYKIVNGIEK